MYSQKITCMLLFRAWCLLVTMQETHNHIHQKQCGADMKIYIWFSPMSLSFKGQCASKKWCDVIALQMITPLSSPEMGGAVIKRQQNNPIGRLGRTPTLIQSSVGFKKQGDTSCSHLFMLVFKLPDFWRDEMKTITDIFSGTKSPATVLSDGIVHYIKHSGCQWRWSQVLSRSFGQRLNTRNISGQIRFLNALRPQFASFLYLLKHVHHVRLYSLRHLDQNDLKQAKSSIIINDLIYFFQINDANTMSAPITIILSVSDTCVTTEPWGKEGWFFFNAEQRGEGIFLGFWYSENTVG